MLSAIKYRLALAKLHKARRNLIDRSPIPIEGEEYEPDFELEMERLVAEHRIQRLASDYAYETAFKIGVPIPVGDEYWESSEAFPGTQHLNAKGLAEVRASIDEERRRRREHYTAWIAGVTGLVGAATGLVAILTE